MVTKYALGVPELAHNQSARASRLIASVSRLEDALRSHAFQNGEPVRAVHGELDAVCQVTRTAVTRYASRLDARWSQNLDRFEQDLSSTTDYVVVLAAPARPAITTPELRAVSDMARQLLAELSAVGSDLLITPGRPADGVSHAADRLLAVAADYRGDAQRDSRVTLILSLASGVLMLAAIGFIVWGILTVTAKRPAAATETTWPAFSMYLVASALCLVGACVTVIQVERRRRSAQEAIRLARQFDVVEAYLQPMSSHVRDIMRAALTPRLFSRILVDDDPLREPIWPTAQDISKASRSARHAKVPRAKDKST
jgi:hypothetical protein